MISVDIRGEKREARDEATSSSAARSHKRLKYEDRTGVVWGEGKAIRSQSSDEFLKSTADMTKHPVNLKQTKISLVKMSILVSTELVKMI